MLPIPAVCQNGHIFALPPNMFGGDNVNLKLTGNVTTCPRCGAPAQIGDAEFKATPKGMVMVSASSLTRELLARLAGVVQEAKEATPDAETLLRQVRVIAPDVADAIAPKLAKGGVASWVIVLAIFWFVTITQNTKTNFDVKLDLNTLFDQIVAAAQKADDPEAMVRTDSPPPTLLVEAVAKEVAPKLSDTQPQKPLTKRQKRRARGKSGAAE